MQKNCRINAKRPLICLAIQHCLWMTPRDCHARRCRTVPGAALTSRNVTYFALCLRQCHSIFVTAHHRVQVWKVGTHSLSSHTPLIIPLLFHSLPHIWPTPWLMVSLVKTFLLLSPLKVNAVITSWEHTISFIKYSHSVITVSMNTYDSSNFELLLLNSGRKCSLFKRLTQRN